MVRAASPVMMPPILLPQCVKDFYRRKRAEFLANACHLLSVRANFMDHGVDAAAEGVCGTLSLCGDAISERLPEFRVILRFDQQRIYGIGPESGMDIDA